MKDCSQQHLQQMQPLEQQPKIEEKCAFLITQFASFTDD
jgi:hypothetical protein